jgi:hypothetical protein
MVIESFGVPVGIRVNRPELLDRVIERLPVGWSRREADEAGIIYSLRFAGATDRPGVRHYNLLYFGPGRKARTLDQEELLDRFEGELHHVIALAGAEHVFVHAGVVGWRGKAIVLPGRSRAGKTTLVEALVRAGATYYSDEYAAVDEQGHVHPFPRPLRVRTEDGTKRRSIEELGGTAGSGPLPVGLVAMTRYRPGVAWRPRRLSKGELCLGLMENTIPARFRAQRALEWFKGIADSAEVIRGSRGDADAAAAALLSRCRW